EVAVDRLEPAGHRVVDDDEMPRRRQRDEEIDAHEIAAAKLGRRAEQHPLAVALHAVLATQVDAGIDRRRVAAARVRDACREIEPAAAVVIDAETALAAWFLLADRSRAHDRLVSRTVEARRPERLAVEGHGRGDARRRRFEARR